MSTISSVALPNVLLILCHDLGDSLGCYGGLFDTPNIDALAGGGVLFQDHFAAGVTASPSRGSVVTGCYPHTHGLMGQLLHGWVLDVERRQALPRILLQAGYETHLFGFQHEHVSATRLGYRYVHDLRSYYAEDVAGAFSQWLGARSARGYPFFACLSFWEAHRIGLNPSHYRRETYDMPNPAAVEVPCYLPDLPELREDMAGFQGAVAHADRQVGVVLRELERCDLLEDTLVIFTTDGGPSFMHAKGTLYEAGVRLPLLMRWPARLVAGRRVPGLTSQVDVLPTLLELLGLPSPSRIEGQSRLALIEGTTLQGADAVYAEKNHEHGFSPARMVRTSKHKYICKDSPRCIYDEVLQELELSRSSFRENREMFSFYSARRVKEEFYDLEADPAELCNLAEDPAWGERLSTMRDLLETHLHATYDPFLELRSELPIDPESYERVRKAQRRD